MPRHPWRTALAALIAAALILPSAAGAAAGDPNSIYLVDGVVTVSAAAGFVDEIYVQDIDTTSVFIRTAPGSTYTDRSANCVLNGTDFGYYQRWLCSGSTITKVVAKGGDMTDYLGPWCCPSTNHVVEYRGGDDDDYLYGTDGVERQFGEGGNDQLYAYGGNDVQDGGPGADQIFGFDGNDTLTGGDDRDTLNGGTGADTLDGGAGFDTADYSERGAGQGVNISLDDAANDGEPAEGDNVQTSVEDVRGGEGNDTLTGNDLANELFGGGGLDVINGKGGTDRFTGGAGADTILARDGNPERIDCGTEADEATTDTVDEVADCETVKADATQVKDGDLDGFATPQDCNDTDKGVNPGATDVPNDGIDQNCDGADAQILDADGDGFNKGVDCDDSNPNAKPGGTEIVGNDVDENCDLFAPPTPVVETPVNLFFFHSGGITFVTGAGVGELEAGTTVVVRCKGKKSAGCPKKKLIKKTVTKKTASFSFFKQYRKARLRKGATIEVVITKPGAVGRFVIFKMKPRAVPTPKPMCVNPGQTKATAC